jgi:hypothetical protein
MAAVILGGLLSSMALKPDRAADARAAVWKVEPAEDEELA